MLIWLTASAFAQDAIRLKAVRTAQHGFSVPSLTFDSNVHGAIEASLSCGRKSWTLKEGVTPGSSATITMEGLPKGQHTCTGKLSLTQSDGSGGEMPLKLTVAVLEPLKLAVAPEDLDLEQHRLRVTSDRPLSKVVVTAIGLGGAELGGGEIGAGGHTSVEMEWHQQPGEVLKLLVKGYDADELPGLLELSPWSYAIPHEDVVFASGSHDIVGAEEPKLESAWADLQRVLDKYGSVVDVKLYVAGYTDTMGSPSSNQSLSERRARSIASWFRSRGFGGSVSYQGFGEDVLAKPTPDETDEPANRRAVYILAASPPPLSTELPRRNWRGL